MEDLFRIESARATVRWLGLAAPPPTIGVAAVPAVEVRPLDAKVIYPSQRPPRLFEQRDYRVVVRGRARGSRVELRHRDPEIVSGILPAEDGVLDLVIGTLNFRGQVGQSRFEVWVDGHLDLTFEVEVSPSKLDYREDYEQILAEVQNLLTALAFEYLRATHTGAQDSEGPPTALEWALKLRFVVDDLERGLRQIARSPIRGLRREVHTIRAEQVRRPDAAVLRAARTGGGEGAWVELGLGLGVNVRQRLPTRRAEPTLDTAEHRWLADNLARVCKRLAQIILEESKRPASPRQMTALAELRAMESRLARLVRLEPLAAASEPAKVGFTSLQLLRAPGYREAARSLIALQLGLRLEGNALELSLKDVATLYEYWCYLAVLDLVSQRTGQAIDPRELVEVQATGLKVLLKKGRATTTRFRLPGGRQIRVEYNPRYDGHVLLSQQPDIVLAVDEPGRPTVRVVLDAKYRVDASVENTEKLGVVGPPPDAINVLHRYRDAILTVEPSPDEGSRVARSVVYAASLYPANVSADAFEASKLARQLRVVGVGAVPFLPLNREVLGRWLDGLLGLEGWSLAQGAQPAAFEPWVWRAASQVVVVGVLRSASERPAREHLEWCLRERCYYLPERETRHGRQAAVTHVALYVPGALSENRVGAVRWVGEVVESRVVERSEVATPWGARAAAGLVRVYRVDAFRELPRAIPNVDGHRMSSPRWSTRLALERAQRLSELALESPLEWSLVDALREVGVEFEVRAGEVDAIEGRPRGRARLLIEGGLEVRYEGANGFKLLGEGLEVYRPTVQAAVEEVKRSRAQIYSSLL